MFTHFKLPILLFIFFNLFNTYANAQYSHYEGQGQIFIGGAKTGISNNYHLGFAYHFKNKLAVTPQLSFETAHPHQTKYSNIGLDVGALYSLANIGEMLNINITGAGVVCYETIKGISSTTVSGFGLNYGIRAGGEIEYNLNSQISFAAFGSQYYLLKKESGSFRYNIGLTAKFNILE
ncbi:MAG: hypothetical protein WBP45_14870 [Daejeonella sp.]